MQTNTLDAQHHYRPMSSDFLSFLLTTPSTTQPYTLSLHDALPISTPCCASKNTEHNRGDPVKDRGNQAHLISRVHLDRKSTRLNSSHVAISYAVFCLKKKNILKHQVNNKNIDEHQYYSKLQ